LFIHQQYKLFLVAIGRPLKFCIIGALLESNNSFYGVEYREELNQISNEVKNTYSIHNAYFITKNFSDIDFNDFDGIYFFNSFHERIDESSNIDTTSQVSYDLYKKYTQDFFSKINAMPEGTRLVTYYTNDLFVPYTYRIIDKSMNDNLKFYIKCDEAD
jgi:hypothetical protein